jgi:endonuclease/exonuclease/phosphatase family metal-dependent hydrolase
MPTIRICSFNGEWMNNWFTPDALAVDFKPTFPQDNHVNNTAQTVGRAGALLRAIDADIVALQEAPSRAEELALFIQDQLSDNGAPRYQFFLGDSGGAQKLALLYKPGSVTSAQLAPHPEIAMLLESWFADIDADGNLEDYQFTRVPLVVNLQFNAHALQLLVMHTKSSFINNGQQMWNDPATRHEYVVGSLKNRRRNSSEGARVRRYLDQVLTIDVGANLIILGDLNDGPGMDYFEENFLTHNVTDILVGSAFEPEWIFHHAQHDLPPAQRFTAIFDEFVPTPVPNKHLLLDHILLSGGLSRSSGLRRVVDSGTVHHVEYAAQITNNGANREDRPSDHRPVSVQLRY